MCLAACSRLFINTQSLIGDGVFLNLTMMEAQLSVVRLDGARVGRRLLASMVAENPRDQVVFFDLLWFYLQGFQDNYFISFCLLISTCVAPCNLIFN
jgi:hypothetical protein